MELEKNRNKINQIKYKPISQRAYPITKNEENQKNSTEEKNKSFSPNPNQNQIKNKNSIIKKNYIHSLLKSSSTSCIKETIKNSPSKKIEVKKIINQNSPKKKNPFQNNFLQFQSSINNIKTNIKNNKKSNKIKRSNSFSNSSDKLHKDLILREPEKPAKTKKDLKIHPFLSRLSLKTLETVHENAEIEESEEFSVTTSASNTPLKEGKNYSLLRKYLNNTNNNFFGNSKILERKKIIKKPVFKKHSKIVMRSFNNNNVNNNNSNNINNNNTNTICNIYNNYVNDGNNYINDNRINNYNNNSFVNCNNIKENFYFHSRINKSYDYISKTYDFRNNYKLNNNNNNNNCNLEELIKVEDLIIIEEKFKTIEKFLNEANFDLINKVTLEWWNYYFNCSLKGNLSEFFFDKKVQAFIEESNTFTLISILIIYELSFKPEYFNLCLKLIKLILTLINKNYLLSCNNLLSKVKKENNFFIQKLKSIIQREINNRDYFINQLDKNMNEICEKINTIFSSMKQNSNILSIQIREIYTNYKKYTSENINQIFLKYILRLNNKGGSILYSFQKTNYPKTFMIKKSQLKPLTLFLDLNETLISFVYTNENEGFSRIRPYLFQFLNLIKNYYECIIFTSSTRDYADPIIDCIEETRGSIFNYRLYRDNCTYFNNYYIKDISKFGRELSKCIIVDNIIQTFILHKENSILISSFWGEDKNDNSLLFLGKILVTIALEMIEHNYTIDIRDVIFKYREDILGKVSLK